jgi:hypothetical protein
MKRERKAKPVRQRIVLLGLLAAAGAPATALYADPACSCSGVVSVKWWKSLNATSGA